MTYRIRISQRAKSEIADFIRHVAEVKKEPLNAGSLLEAIYDRSESLQHMPHRCPEAPESELVSPVVRMLIVKRSLLILYTVNDPDGQVTVHGFRYGSRSPLDLSGEISEK